MALLSDIIGRGLHSARPAAGTVGKLYYETDTTTLFRDNGSSWDSVEGTSSGGYTQGARAYNSANLSIADNTVTALTLNSERYDTDTIHSTSVNTSRLTCQTTGVYVAVGCVQWAQNTSGRRLVFLRLNGTTNIGAVEQNPDVSGSVFSQQTVTTFYPLTATDYLELCVFQNSGGSLNVVAAGNSSPELMMQRIG